MLPLLITDRFLEPSTGLVHLGEPNCRDERSEWPWMACGKKGFMRVTERPITCMGCAAGIQMHS